MKFTFTIFNILWIAILLLSTVLLLRRISGMSGADWQFSNIWHNHPGLLSNLALMLVAGASLFINMRKAGLAKKNRANSFTKS